MPNEPKTAYWDANVFLSYVNGLTDRLLDIDPLLQDARDGKVVLVTSALSIVEVAFGAAEQQAFALDAATEQKISSLWTPPSPVKIVEFYGAIAEDARSLIRFSISQGWSLKPLDAVHLSTAQRMNVDECHTYDSALEKYAAEVGFPIGPPVAGSPMLFPPGPGT